MTSEERVLDMITAYVSMLELAPNCACEDNCYEYAFETIFKSAGYDAYSEMRNQHTKNNAYNAVCKKYNDKPLEYCLYVAGLLGGLTTALCWDFE